MNTPISSQEAPKCCTTKQKWKENRKHSKHGKLVKNIEHGKHQV
jgi:hypothetical protein